MSEFKDYSLPELYGNTSQGPQNPTQVNWKSVAIYGGLAIGTAVVFALVINHAMDAQMRHWCLHSENLNQRYIEAIEKQEARIAKLAVQVSTGAAKWDPEKEVLVENSMKA